MRKKKRQYIYMTLPAILMMAIFILIPLLNAIKISFFRWNGYSQNMRFYGLENYRRLFEDEVFWRTLGNTMIYGFGSMILQNIGGLLAALYLNQKFKGRNMMRAVLYLPIMISGFIMGQILYYFVQYDGGVFNELLGMLGVPPVYWMETGLSSVIMVTLANAWQYMGLCMVIYLAGLQNIPAMYREAARLDGAGKLQEFFHIIVPLLMPAIITAVVTNLIGGFKMYDVIVSMAPNGGPNRTAMSLSYYIQLLYFNDEKAGYASAVGIVTFFVILLITLPINKWLKRREVEY